MHRPSELTGTDSGLGYTSPTFLVSDMPIDLLKRAKAIFRILEVDESFSALRSDMISKCLRSRLSYGTPGVLYGVDHRTTEWYPAARPVKTPKLSQLLAVVEFIFPERSNLHPATFPLTTDPLISKLGTGMQMQRT